jgi:hypothetical protein
LVFFQDALSQVKDVIYSFKVTDSNGNTIRDSKDQKALDGTSTQVLRFTKPDPINILISIDAVAGQTAGGLVENVEFHLAVTDPSLNSVK